MRSTSTGVVLVHTSLEEPIILVLLGLLLVPKGLSIFFKLAIKFVFRLVVVPVPETVCVGTLSTHFSACGLHPSVAQSVSVMVVAFST